MKKTIVIKKIIEREKVISIICDCCGKEVIDNSYSIIQSYEFEFGYGTNFDGEVWKSDICSNCITYWLKSFKIKPKIERK